LSEAEVFVDRKRKEEIFKDADYKDYWIKNKSASICEYLRPRRNLLLIIKEFGPGLHWFQFEQNPEYGG